MCRNFELEGGDTVNTDQEIEYIIGWEEELSNKLVGLNETKQNLERNAELLNKKLEVLKRVESTNQKSNDIERFLEQFVNPVEEELKRAIDASNDFNQVYGNEKFFIQCILDEIKEEKDRLERKKKRQAMFK